MKKLLCLLLALTLCLALAACGGNSEPAPASGSASPSSAAPEPESESESEAGPEPAGDGGAAPADFSAVTSYTEIPVLNGIKDKLIPVPAGLVGSWWNFAGGLLDGRDMTQEEAEAVVAAYGGYLACNFDPENASITKEPYILYGPYTVQEDGYTVLLKLENMEDGTSCPYVGVFTEMDGTQVMVMISSADPSTVLYMAALGEDAG